MDHRRPPESERPLRIVYLTLEATRRGQAAHTHVHEIVAGLRRLGASVELIEPRHSAQASPAHPAMRAAAFLPLQVRAARKLAGADLLYLRAHPFALPIDRIARLRSVPVVHEINGRPADLSITYPWLKPVAGAVSALQRVQYRTASGLVAVTPELVAWARRESGGRPSVALIVNAANTEVFHPAAPGGPRIEGSYVVFFGGLVRWHGIATILAAAAHREWPADMGLVIAGSGLESAKVREAAQRLPHVTYLGFIPQPEVAGVAARASACLVATEDVGDLAAGGLAPLKLFESLAAGRPVVATDLPFQAALVRDNGVGIVVPPGDPEALARAVARIAADPDSARNMGERARRLAMDRHSWPARAADTLAFLRGVVALERDGADVRPS